MDDDNDPDILSASITDNKIAWHQNNDINLEGFSEHFDMSEPLGQFLVNSNR